LFLLACLTISPFFAASCEALASLKLLSTTITEARVITTGGR